MGKEQQRAFLHNVLVLANIFEIGEQAILQLSNNGLGNPEDAIDVNKVSKTQMFTKMNHFITDKI